jgi:choline dehydrogenase-like flavoprotein
MLMTVLVDPVTISANLGVNPALTITALAERAMSLWPNKGEPDPPPPLGAAYARVSPVAARCRRRRRPRSAFPSPRNEAR